MAVAHLVGSTYTRSNTNYTQVTDADNMYDPVSDTSDYGTLRGRNRNSSTAYYIFIHGFDFSQIPSNATVTDFSVKVKCYRSSNQRTGTNFYLRLSYAHTSGTVISGTTTSTNIGTDTAGSIITIPTGTLEWSDIVGYGSNFSIEFPLASTSSSYPYIYVYGAEIEVTYTIPNPRTVTTTLNGNGTIEPSGTETYYDGDEYNLAIEPANTSDTVTATKNGVDITSELEVIQPGETTVSAVLGAYDLISGGFNGSGASYFQGIVGHGHDTSSVTTSNYYSSGSGTEAIFQYSIVFEGIPENAEIESLYMMANGHAESTSSNSEYMCVQLKSGSTELSEQYNFKSAGSTSNSTQTIYATTLPTVEQLQDLVVEMTLGYYGGAINGVTVFLTYKIDQKTYTYSTTVSSDMTIAVTIGGGGSTATIYYKVNGAWVAAAAVYKKVNGSWVQQTDLSTVFDSSTNYVKG